MNKLFDKLMLDETETEENVKKEALPETASHEGRRHRRRKKTFGEKAKEAFASVCDAAVMYCGKAGKGIKKGVSSLGKKAKPALDWAVEKIESTDKRIVAACAAALALIICVPIGISIANGGRQVNAVAENLPTEGYSSLPSSEVNVTPMSVIMNDPTATPVMQIPDPTNEAPIDLKPGVTAEQVIELQEKLMSLGYMDPDEPTDFYGPMTTAAVKLFQNKNELKADGVAGEITLALLYSGNAKEYVATNGDSGEDIRGMQERLYELGYIENSKEADGKFGDATEAAVKKFQENNGLVVDGKLGVNTKEMLYSEEAKANAYSKGDQSEAIKKYQTKLQKLGYLTTKPDGKYGDDTVTAVRRFQEANGLIADGYLGPQTRDLLMSNSAQASALKLGDSGDQVRTVQERLKKLGYLKANATGYFGSDTEAAVKAFQKRNKLAQDGKIGPATLAKLNSGNAVSASGGGGGGSSNTSGIDRLIRAAESKLGKPYVLGAKGPNKFDCSGLAYWCINQAGIKQGYMTSRAWRTCTKYPRIKSIDSVRRGDIIIYKMSESKGHVGIAISSSMMIDASSNKGKVVKRSFKTAYWKKMFYCAYRIF